MSRELLKMALDALETGYSDYLYDGAGPAIAGAFEADIAALRAALAQPAPEPVAWAMLRPNGLVLDVICPDERDAYQGEYTVPLYSAPLADEIEALRQEGSMLAEVSVVLTKRVKVLEDALRGMVNQPWTPALFANARAVMEATKP